MATVCANNDKKGGFVCEFEKEPQKEFQTKCPECNLIPREPYQVSCCGHNFCEACIDGIKSNKKPCPTCKEENFDTFHNKGLQRSLYQFQVYCSHNQEGCEWKGELGQLDNHLNLSPQPDKQLEGCEHSVIECIYCSELIKRGNTAKHQNDLCSKRPFSCEYCHSYESQYEDVTLNHWPVCGYHPVRCPNKCGKFPQRQALENHVTIDCPNTVIDCDFHHIGCDLRLPRKDMPAHLKNNLVTHMSLQAASCKALQNKVEKLERENETLKLDILQIEHHTGILLATTSKGYVEHTMEDFQTQKDTKSRQWFSTPFYSHPRGYKLCLSAIANGYGEAKGTHVSVGVYVMTGEFDNDLKWPFRAEISVQLVDQEEEKEHVTKTIFFNNEKEKTLCTVRVTKDLIESAFESVFKSAEKVNPNGALGHPKFISHTDLSPKYLKNDCLRFRVFVKRD